MTNHVYDRHNIPTEPGEKLGDTVQRHLTTTHGSIVLSGSTLNEMSDQHARLHLRMTGNEHPETDSSTTLRQKYVIVVELTELGISLPDWVYEHSFLSDLTTLQRIILSAHLARPGVPFPGHEAGFDNQGKA